jgi:hypothetical protein
MGYVQKENLCNLRRIRTIGGVRGWIPAYFISVVAILLYVLYE